jgi:putative ABC transport system permease protein
MLKHFFISTFRNFARQKVYSLLNILSLTFGIAVCILVYLFISNELSYDSYHSNYNNIYRVTMTEEQDGNERNFANTFSPLAPQLKTEFPEIEQVVRIFPGSRSVRIDEGRLYHEEEFAFADPNFFEIFTFEFIKGNAEVSLKEPNSIVISEEVAEKYFGNENPLGKILTIDGEFIFKVTGVFKTNPLSSLRWNIYAAMSSVNDVEGSWIFNSHKSWYYPPMYTFLLIRNENKFEYIKNRLPDFTKKILGENFQPHRSFHIQPFKDIHLTAGLENEPYPTSSRIYLNIFSIVGILILLIAGINFTNLAVVRATKRAKEVGLKKTSGASNTQILTQFIGESIITAFISLLFSVVIIEVALPFINSMFELQLNTSILFTTHVITGVLFFTIIIGLIAGFYPAFILSGINPTEIFKGSYGIKRQRKSVFSFKEVLIAFQFIISAGIIISAFVIQRQLNFISQTSLGFNKEHLVVLPVKDANIQKKFSVFKEKLYEKKGIISVASISNLPWETGFYDFPTKINNRGKDLYVNPLVLLIDNDFAKTFDIKLKAGRDFSREMISDEHEAFLINNSAVQKFGLINPVGTKIHVDHLSAGEPKSGEIIGVVNDFHFQSLYHKVEPLIITISNDYYYYDNVVIRLDGNNLTPTLKEIEEVWKDFSPKYAFQFFFLDNAFDNLYKNEMRLSSIFNSFSVLSVIIGALGMFGLASYSIQNRRKEIGIRKVLGANVSGIVLLFSKEFLILVIIANVISWPIVYYAMQTWLNNFAYRTEMSIWIFVLSAIIGILVVILTVSFQAVKAGLSNPMKSLRYE